MVYLSRLDNRNPDFLALCIQASILMKVLGNPDMAEKFLYCETSGEFNALCYDLAGYDGSNEYGDALVKELTRIRIVETIVGEIDVNDPSRH